MELIEDLLPHMRHVLTADRDLRDLRTLWSMIEATSAIACPEHAESVLSTLSATRERFGALQERLVMQLGAENLAELQDELASTAQCTIDILVRNLFERTADVGFLATDDVLRAHCALPPEARADQRAALEQRLADYRAKYTVYDDIIVTDPDGQILARLDGASRPLEFTGDNIVAVACQQTGYVESFGLSDLSRDERPALRYAHRIESTDGHLMGVLILRFALVDEMKRIFSGNNDSRRQVAVVLLDDQNRVVVSNDEAHVPLGAQMRPGDADHVGLTTFAGREYLALTCKTRGYQGYGGPGWQAMAMVSLLVAFNVQVAPATHDDQMSLDSRELAQIRVEVDTINRNLRRMVWNGRVASRTAMTSQLQLKAVLQQVNEAGAAMRQRVGKAIADLYRTAIGRTHQQAGELARLAADIMDRNLYERANDCRWWALSPAVRSRLAQPDDAQGLAQLQEVLAHINGLYTVYSRIVAFDLQGVVRAVSCEDERQPVTGTQVDEKLREAVLSLSDPQRYAVSSFVGTTLDHGRLSYVYAAAVRHPDSSRVVGGIAVVFNAEREFRAMLDDVLAGREGVAAFVDAQGQVIASTVAEHPPGSRWPLPLSSQVVEFGGLHQAMTVQRATGYREFKTSDGYRNDVMAVVALRLGAVERRGTSLADHTFRSPPLQERRQLREYALFHVGAHLCAVSSDHVLEALPCDRLVRTPRSHPLHAGLLEVGMGAARQFITVMCARQMMGLNYPARTDDGVVLVFNGLGAGRDPTQPLMGLRVDGVAQVLDLDASRLQALPSGIRRMSPWTAGILELHTPDGAPVLLQVLDASAMLDLLALPGLASSAEAGDGQQASSHEGSPADEPAFG